MDAVEKRVIELTSKDGTRIVCEKAGAGPAVVLVDGAFCFRRSGVTPRLVPLLSNNFTVYAYDRRGRGDSGNTLPYSVEREIEDLQAVMAAAGGSPFVVAFSSGAALAMRAVAAGLRPKKLVVFEPPYVGNGDVPAVPADAIEQLNARIASGRRSDAVTYFMTEIFGAPRLVVTLMKLFGRPSAARQPWSMCRRSTGSAAMKRMQQRSAPGYGTWSQGLRRHRPCARRLPRLARSGQ